MHNLKTVTLTLIYLVDFYLVLLQMQKFVSPISTFSLYHTQIFIVLLNYTSASAIHNNVRLTATFLSYYIFVLYTMQIIVIRVNDYRVSSWIFELLTDAISLLTSFTSYFFSLYGSLVVNQNSILSDIVCYMQYVIRNTG